MYSFLQGYIPSVSMTSTSVNFFFFFCPFPFFLLTLNLLSILIAYSLLCFLLEFSLSAIFPLIDLLHCFPSIELSACQGKIVEAACTDKSMLPVTSDAHNSLSVKFRTCSNHQVSFLTWIHPVIPSTSCINGCFACVKFDCCRSLCYVASIACLHV